MVCVEIGKHGLVLMPSIAIHGVTTRRQIWRHHTTTNDDAIIYLIDQYILPYSEGYHTALLHP